MRKSLMVVLAGLLSSVAFAQAPAPAPAAAPALTGFKADCLSDIEFVGKRLVDLAEKMPADTYG